MTELEKELKIITGEQREHERAEKDERRAERDFGRQETASISNETENVKETEDEMRQISKQGDEREVGKDKTGKEVFDKSQHSETEQTFGEREEERQRSEEREGEKENDLTRKEFLSTSHGVTKVPKNAEVNTQKFIQLKEFVLSAFFIQTYSLESSVLYVSIYSISPFCL